MKQDGIIRRTCGGQLSETYKTYGAFLYSLVMSFVSTSTYPTMDVTSGPIGNEIFERTDMHTCFLGSCTMISEKIHLNVHPIRQNMMKRPFLLKSQKYMRQSTV